MPFKSKAQQRYLEANPGKVKNIKEWEKATDFKKLPARAKKKKKNVKR